MSPIARSGTADSAAAKGASRRRPFWKALGPGLITGASDDDPSGIATYSQAGAQFGFGLAWMLVITYPLMVVIQVISGQLGRTTGRGIAGNLREHYPKALLHGTVMLLFVANTLNIGADLGAMAAAADLILPLSHSWLYAALFGLICGIGQIVIKHKRYTSTLKWLSLSLLAYVATVCVIKVPWHEVARGLLPAFPAQRHFWMMVVAILGTTISPYLFFWQATEEVEDTLASEHRQPLKEKPQQGHEALTRIRTDTAIGMALSNLVALAILITAGATLHAQGIHNIDSAADAAQALKPVAGEFAFALFALGIIGTGLLSVPVLAGSAAYALGEAQHWTVGFDRRPSQAKAFYGALAVAVALGVAMNLFSINPLTALVWVAVINGIVAVPVMTLLMLMARNERIMGRFCISARWADMGWATTALMGVAVIILLTTLVRGQS